MSHKRKLMKSLPVRENTFSTRKMVRENFEMESVEVAALRAEELSQSRSCSSSSGHLGPNVQIHCRNKHVYILLQKKRKNRFSLKSWCVWICAEVFW